MTLKKFCYFSVIITALCFVLFCQLSPSETLEVNLSPPTKVYLGGQAVGLVIESDGVVVLGTNTIMTKDGLINTVTNELEAGDIIKSINGEKISTTKSIGEILNRPDADVQSRPDTVTVRAVRKNKEIEIKLKPAYDVAAKKYKLGLWVRDDASGIGTLTYVREDNLRFGALGHPVSDSSTGVSVDARSGAVYSCEIMGINRGDKGYPGELKGLIMKGSKQGSINKNNKYGVFGELKSDCVFLDSERLVEISGRTNVRPGKAKICASLDGEKVEEFDIEIIKTNYQTHSNEKSFVFKVKDKGLLKRTGGIIQGMSGSPIIQNGKLVGAVTHVFVNDPTKGFGIYADWMINE